VIVHTAITSLSLKQRIISSHYLTDLPGKTSAESEMKYFTFSGRAKTRILARNIILLGSPLNSLYRKEKKQNKERKKWRKKKNNNKTISDTIYFYLYCNNKRDGKAYRVVVIHYYNLIEMSKCWQC